MIKRQISVKLPVKRTSLCEKCVVSSKSQHFLAVICQRVDRHGLSLGQMTPPPLFLAQNDILCVRAQINLTAGSGSYLGFLGKYASTFEIRSPLGVLVYNGSIVGTHPWVFWTVVNAPPLLLLINLDGCGRGVSELAIKSVDTVSSFLAPPPPPFSA